jgi:peptidoglycan/xylan/chitin deacetylase (PgdA/CDA1 family)
MLKGELMRAGDLRHPPVLVLGYHDVVAGGDYSSWLKVPADVFDEQVRFLRTIGHFIAPADLLEPERLRHDRLNLLMTFDDGFAGNFTFGYPVIRRYCIPSLFFISTWNMQSGEPFWFDQIISLIQRHRLTRFDLRHLGLRDYRFSLLRKNMRWTGIQSLLDDVKRGNVAGNGRCAEKVVAALEKSCGVISNKSAQEECSPLTRDQVVEMYRSGLCHFGSHSHRHGILTALEDDDLAAELTTSRRILEDLLDDEVTHISYPNGDTNERVKRASMDAGYRFGYKTASACVNEYTDRLEIPRLLIGGYDSSAGILWQLRKILLKSRCTNGREGGRRAERSS